MLMAFREIIAAIKCRATLKSFALAQQQIYLCILSAWIVSILSVCVCVRNLDQVLTESSTNTCQSGYYRLISGQIGNEKKN